MAGRGSRLRPHTLVTPKPLVAVAGKPIVEWLVEDLMALCPEQVSTIGYVIGDFGKEVEDNLLAGAKRLGAKGKIYYQEEPLGTAHAIMCAAELLDGPVIVAFADTLFKTDYKIDPSQEGVIFVQRVEDPRAFGVVKLSEEGYITDFVEKPETFVSDLAIIGIYYFRDSHALKAEMQHLLDNDIRSKGEFQLTDAMETLKKKGSRFVPGEVEEWLDCGNKDATVNTNQRMLEIKYPQGHIDSSADLQGAVVIHPCYVGPHAKVKESVIGPHVSIGSKSTLLNCVIKNSIIQNNAHLHRIIAENSMAGSHVTYHGNAKDLSIGDYTNIKE